MASGRVESRRAISGDLPMVLDNVHPNFVAAIERERAFNAAMGAD